MANLVIRHDDYDFRMDPKQYIAIHEEFIKAGLIETAVLQFTTDGHIKTFQPELINYMNTTSNWDFQLHGWAHDRYSEWETDYIIRDMSAAVMWCQKLFNKTPTVWYTPWNQWSNNMEQAAKVIGLTISNESYDIARFIREVESKHYEGTTMYFHGWKSDEMLLFPKMLEMAKEVYARP